MKRTIFKVAAGLFAAAIVTVAVAQELEGVTVQASRVVTGRIGRTAMGAPIDAVSLSYRVKYTDLNLGTKEGAATLEARVKEAAEAACAEIGHLYPDARPNDLDCTKAAVKEAMVRVHEVVAAAGKAK